MGEELVYDVFLSYRRAQPDQHWVKEHLVPALELAGLKVCWDERDFDPGQHVLREMDRALRQSRRTLCILSPDYFEGNRPTLYEALAARSSDPAAQDSRLIPLILYPTKIPDWMSSVIAVNWTADNLEMEWRKLLKILEAKNPNAPAPSPAHRSAGIAPRALVFEGDGLLPGQVFAVELLTQPILLSRNRHGRTILAVNRDDVSDALYTTEAKWNLCRETFNTPERIEKAKQMDREIHRFLLGCSDDNPLLVRLDGMPLRWASGGVLSIVHWKKRLWTPFFFRDIPPFGWNIALGASERGDNLNDPWTFLLREFLEETLVLSNAPRRGRLVDFKRFFPERLDIKREVERADRFAAEHIKVRRRNDGLVIRVTQDPIHLTGLDRQFCVILDFFNTATDVLIEHNGHIEWHGNVLACINPLELGIEVVKVVEYTLEEDNYILSGELLDFGTHKELLRMPVALIAHDYLAQAFGDEDLRYTGDVQPSVEAPAIPPDCIHIFDYDARRRREIALGIEQNSSPWERQCYGEWLKKFGSYFFDDSGEVTNAHASTWFTPSSAKIISYFFANLQSRNLRSP